jgi:hypothetical protein
MQFTCVTGTKVQMLTSEQLPFFCFRLPDGSASRADFAKQVCSLLALLVQKYKY